MQKGQDELGAWWTKEAALVDQGSCEPGFSILLVHHRLGTPPVGYKGKRNLPELGYKARGFHLSSWPIPKDQH